MQLAKNFCGPNVDCFIILLKKRSYSTYNNKIYFLIINKAIVINEHKSSPAPMLKICDNYNNKNELSPSAIPVSHPPIFPKSDARSSDIRVPNVT